jgi:hypothetical protein
MHVDFETEGKKRFDGKQTSLLFSAVRTQEYGQQIRLYI